MRKSTTSWSYESKDYEVAEALNTPEPNNVAKKDNCPIVSYAKRLYKVVMIKPGYKKLDRCCLVGLSGKGIYWTTVDKVFWVIEK